MKKRKRKKKSIEIGESKKGLTCSFCSEEFSNIIDLRSHKRTVHVNVECEICNKTFENLRKLKKHLNQHNKKKIQKKCEICGKLITASMNRHVLDMHGNRSVKPFKCDLGRHFTLLLHT